MATQRKSLEVEFTIRALQQPDIAGFLVDFPDKIIVIFDEACTGS